MSFSFSELLRRASKTLGKTISERQARYAINQGYLTNPEKLPNGWRQYSSHHVDELVAYMRTRSRLALSGSPESEATGPKVKGAR
jgi:hypothetical protein